MGKIVLLAVNKDYTSQFEESELYKNLKINEFVYKILQKDSHKAYLIKDNTITNNDSIVISEEHYLYFKINSIYDFSGLTLHGTWEEAVSLFEINIVGSMTFIIRDKTSDDTHYDYSKNFFSLDIVKDHLDSLTRFYENIGSYEVDCDFFADIDEDSLDEDNDTRCFYDIMREQCRDELTDDLIKDINDKYKLSKLCLSLSEDIEDEKTLIYSLSPGDIRTFMKFEDYILNDLFNDLECIEDDDGIEFAYSTWKKTRNIEIYADLGLDDSGDYVSFPTLYVGEYQGEPESGSWESNS